MAKARTDRYKDQGYDVYMGRTSDPAPSPHRAMNSGNGYDYDVGEITTEHFPSGNKLYLTPDERRVIDALRSIRYGSVTVEIQDGRLRLLRKGETEKLGE